MDFLQFCRIVPCLRHSFKRDVITFFSISGTSLRCSVYILLGSQDLLFLELWIAVFTSLTVSYSKSVFSSAPELSARMLQEWVSLFCSKLLKWTSHTTIGMCLDNLDCPSLSPVVLWLSYSPLDPRFLGSNPAGVNGFFQSVKILSMTSFGREVKLWVLCRRFTARKRTSSWN